MADIVDAATRSRMMSGIRGGNTKPEILVRSILHRHGFRFRLHVRNLPGKPDIVLPRYHAVIFVNGCFWHGHDCHLFRMPKTREAFWREKIGRNQFNDQKNREALIAANWRVGVVWECAIRGKGKDIDSIALCLSEWLHSEEETIEVKG